MTMRSRRRFLQTTAAAGSALSLGYFVNPSPAALSKSPNEKLNIAGIGVTGRGGEDIRGVQHRYGRLRTRRARALHQLRRHP